MRRMLFIVGLLFLTSGVARAACDATKSFEVGGSYDYLRVNTTFNVITENSGTGGGTTSTETKAGLNLNGWNAEVVGNPACWLGIVGEFSGAYGTPSIGGFPISSHIYSYVFGPRLNLHNGSPFTPFAEALFGGAHAGFSNADQGNFSANAFEGNFGGGVDIGLGGNWAIRPKADYVLTHFGGRTQNNGTVSVAIVYKIGK
jgi:hypothetical protein